MAPWVIGVLVGVAALAGGAWWFRQWFRRDPERTVPSGAVVVAPADGKILDVRDVADGQACRIPKGLAGRVEAMTEDLGPGPFTLISIFMNLFNVHVNRTPIAGRVLSVAHHDGRLMAADNPRALIENERTETVLETPIGRVKVLQIAGLVARRVDNWLAEGDELDTGQRIGLIHFGSQVSILMRRREGIEVAVAPGQKVRAGETVLATYQRPTE